MGLPPLLGWGAFRLDEGQQACTVDWRADTTYTFFFLGFVFFLPLLAQCWCYFSIFRTALSHTRRSAKVFPSTITTATTTTTTSTSSTTVTGTAASTSSADSLHEDHGTVRDSKGYSTDRQDCASARPRDVERCCRVLKNCNEATTPMTPRAKMSRSTECKAVKTILLIAAAYFLCWTLFVAVALLKWGGAYVAPSVDMAAWALLFLSGVLNPLIYGFMNRVTRSVGAKGLSVLLLLAFRLTDRWLGFLHD